MYEPAYVLARKTGYGHNGYIDSDIFVHKIALRE